MAENKGFFLSAQQIMVVLLAIAIVLLSLFNNAPVDVSLLFAVVSVPLSVMVLGALLIGVMMGYVLAAQRRKRRQTRQEAKAARRAQKGAAQMLPAAEEPPVDEMADDEAEYAEYEEPGR